MFLHKLIFAGVILLSAGLPGCPGDPAVSTSLGQPDMDPSSATLTRGAKRPGGHKDRRTAPSGLQELSLSAYQNPERGVSLLYPRNYALEEGNIVEHSYFLRRQEELDLERPGATLVATVLIPEDSYPNTTFEHGSLQLITEEGWAKQACLQMQGVGEGQSRRIKSISISGISFEGQENQSLTAGAIVLGRDYTGYQDGTCYEFVLVVAARERSGDEFEESTKPADTGRAMRQLEKIAGSLKVLPKTKAPMATASSEASARL